MQGMIGVMTYEQLGSESENNQYYSLLDSLRVEKIYSPASKSSITKHNRNTSQPIRKIVSESKIINLDKPKHIISTHNNYNMPSNSNGLKINNMLIVDDVLSNRKMLQMLLSRRGYHKVLQHTKYHYTYNILSTIVLIL